MIITTLIRFGLFVEEWSITLPLVFYFSSYIIFKYWFDGHSLCWLNRDVDVGNANFILLPVLLVCFLLSLFLIE